MLPATAARAVQAINKTVPLIFLSQTDPVMAGLVTSLNRPGGNATGVSLLAAQLIGKRLDIVRQLAPGKVTALLRNPTAAEAASQLGEVLEAAHEVGQQIQVLDASTLSEIEAALAAFAKTTASTLILPSDPFLFSHHRRIVELAALHAIPAIYDRREFTLAGGLMSYGTQLSDAYRLIGIYTGKILKGAKPADLPVQQVASFEFVINLKAARAIGLTIPPTVLALADEVIE